MSTTSVRQQILAEHARRDARPALTLRQPVVTVAVNARRDRVHVCRFAEGAYRPDAAHLRIYRRVTESSMRRLLLLLDRPSVARRYGTAGDLRATVEA